MQSFFENLDLLLDFILELCSNENTSNCKILLYYCIEYDVNIKNSPYCLTKKHKLKDLAY